ncbi:hypothetical protein EV360DRAFT_87826 [Lentinula raphanica]|nr:hypothetical protein EV360DRAFT_87826 [Lentinula raphanica]
MAGQKHWNDDLNPCEDDVARSWRRYGMEGGYNALHTPPPSFLQRITVLPANSLSCYMDSSRSFLCSQSPPTTARLLELQPAYKDLIT